MKPELKKVAPICGFLGSSVIITGSLTTAILYHGRGGEPYSILNHFVSELGEVGVSAWAHVFNTGFIIGGVVFLGFMVGFASHVRSGLGYLATAFGIISCISCSLVGVFPMNASSIHTPVAYSFFYNGLTATILFNFAILFDRRNILPKWLIIPGMVIATSFACFFVVPHAVRSTPIQTLGLHRFRRPDILLPAVLEWCVFFSVIAWFVVMSTYLVVKRPTGSIN